MDKLKQHIQDNLDKLDIDHPKENCWNSISSNLAGDTDSFKNHIDQHAAELEIESPAVDTWDRIRSAIATNKPAKVIGINKKWWYAAACLLVLIGMGVLVYVNRPGKKIDDTIVKEQPKISTPVSIPVPVDTSEKGIAVVPAVKETRAKIEPQQKATAKRINAGEKARSVQLPPELLQVQTGYNDLIAAQVKYVQSMPVYGESVDYFESFVIDFKGLDKEEKQLRKTIVQKGLQENSIDELATIYQQKLMILKRLQTEINKTSRNRSEIDTIPGYIRL